MSGEQVLLGKTVKKLFNYPLTGTGLYSVPRSTYHARPNFNVEAISWLARMRPGQPAFNLPAIMGELPDLPSLFTHLPEAIRSWGSANFGRRSARGNYHRPWRAAARMSGRIAAELGSAHVAYNLA